MRDHERIEELLAVRAVGGLDEGEERTLRIAMDEHGADCEECRDLERGFGEATADLAMSLEPVPLRDGFEEQVMVAARGARAPASTPPAADRSDDVIRIDRAASPWSRRLGALAAAAVLLLGGFAVGRDRPGAPTSHPTSSRSSACRATRPA